MTETGSLSGQAIPYRPSPVSSFVTRRNSSQLQGRSGVGMRAPEAFSSFVLAISTRGSWRKGTPWTPSPNVVVRQDCSGMSALSRSGRKGRRSAR